MKVNNQFINQFIKMRRRSNCWLYVWWIASISGKLVARERCKLFSKMVLISRIDLVLWKLAVHVLTLLGGLDVCDKFRILFSVVIPTKEICYNIEVINAFPVYVHTIVGL